MLPQAPQPKSDNSTRVNLLFSLFFHLLIIALLGFFAARQGLLGEQFKKITIQMVKEKPPEKPKEPEKPKTEPPKQEPPPLPQPPRPRRTCRRSLLAVAWPFKPVPTPYNSTKAR